MPSETLVILNPASAAGATGRRRREILHAVESVFGWVDLESTSAPGDATRIARHAAERGVKQILVAGGDGTTSEIVSGILEAETPEASRPPIGLLPLGSGCDLARSLELPRELDAALELIARGGRRRIDVGRAEYLDARGTPSTRFFVNEVSAGLSGATVGIAGPLAKRLGARVGFVVGALAAIVFHRPADLRVEIDGEPLYEGPVSMIVAANGCYFGAGMRVAPNARLDDGRLEIALVRGLSVSRLLANLPSFYLGRHGRHPDVSFHAARTLRVLAKEGAPPIDLDGEALGGVPLYAEVLSGAIEVFAPASGAPAHSKASR
ncbi:MAG: diacylglycerol kinase family lipid kinase [bacterium]|nr:diacylglycerol kinase family lipid kinase [bacterium]